MNTPKAGYLFDGKLSSFISHSGLSIDKPIRDSEWAVSEIFSEVILSQIREKALEAFFSELWNVLSAEYKSPDDLEAQLYKLWANSVVKEADLYKPSIEANTTDRFQSRLKKRVFNLIKTGSLPFIVGFFLSLIYTFYFGLLASSFGDKQIGDGVTPFSMLVYIGFWLWIIALGLKLPKKYDTLFLLALTLWNLALVFLSKLPLMTRHIFESPVGNWELVMTFVFWLPIFVSLMSPLAFTFVLPIIVHKWGFKKTAQILFGWYD